MNRLIVMILLFMVTVINTAIAKDELKLEFWEGTRIVKKENGKIITDVEFYSKSTAIVTYTKEYTEMLFNTLFINFEDVDIIIPDNLLTRYCNSCEVECFLWDMEIVFYNSETEESWTIFYINEGNYLSSNLYTWKYYKDKYILIGKAIIPPHITIYQLDSKPIKQIIRLCKDHRIE